MSAPQTCPECGDDLNPRARKCSCGWLVPASARAGSSGSTASDARYGWCSWESNGQRCRYPGTVTRSTLGSDRWYCVGHATADDPVIAGRMVDESIDDCGTSPDYSLGARLDAFRAAWAAMFPPPRSAATRQEIREALDRGVAQIAGHAPMRPAA